MSTSKPIQERNSKWIFNKRDHLFIAIILIFLILARLWLIAGVPKMLHSNWHDDLYFNQAAHFLMHGEWLGPYSQMTVIKGPFYAFFLAFSSFTGLSLLVNETTFYILACLCLFMAIRPLIKNFWWRVLLFAFLLFSPASLCNEWTLRPYREFVYLSLSLFVIATALGLFLRLDQKLANILTWSLGLGFSMGAFMITREEGVWIYPVLLLLLAVCVFIIFKKRLDQKWLRSALVVLSIFIWYIPTIIVSLVNYSHYGFFGISESLDPDFNKVLNQIQRIKTVEWKAYQPVTRDMIDKASQASPLFAELNPYLNENYDTWLGASNESIWLKPEWYLEEYFKDEPELGAAHFLWMFRDAMQANGKYDSGKFPRDYLRETASQLKSACENHTLDCKAEVNIPLVGSFSNEQIALTIRFLADDFINLIRIDGSAVKNKSLDFTAWNPFRIDYKYFEEIINNPIDSRIFGSQATDDLMIDGHRDLRLSWMIIKSNLMGKILAIQKGLLLPITIFAFSLWIINAVFLIWKRIPFRLDVFILSVFLLALLFLRMSVLAFLDATTNMYAFLYCGSCYLFLYIFLFISFYDSFSNLNKYVLRLKK